MIKIVLWFVVVFKIDWFDLFLFVFVVLYKNLFVGYYNLNVSYDLYFIYEKK